MSEDHAARDAQLAELEAGGRWNDLARTLEQYAQQSSGPRRATLLLRAMKIYRDRFSNHHKAMLAAEGVLEAEDDNPEAVTYLLEIYQKRRMKDALAALQERLERKRQGPYR